MPALDEAPQPDALLPDVTTTLVVYHRYAEGVEVGIPDAPESRRSHAQVNSADVSRNGLCGFHDAVLAHGSVTLPILEDLVADWVTTQAGDEGSAS